jgi:methionine-gamma-lyase
MKDCYKFNTKVMHDCKGKDAFNALVPPIYTSASYRFNSAEEGGASFRGETNCFIYTRLGNPTTNQLEKRIASLEEGEGAVAFASGMGAISTVFYTLLANGDHIVADKTIYGCTFALLNHGLTKLGIEVTFIDFNEEGALKKALKKNTKAVFFETPANPTLKIIDIETVVKTVKQFNPDIQIICDNTFATPYHQQPITMGVDIVVHSGTKYLNGHGDAICGFVVGRNNFIDQCKMVGLKDMTGAVLGPMEAYLILRGIKTLAIRMERHSQNAMEVAKFLQFHPKVERVYYPGLPGFSGHEIAKKQMKNGFGGILSFVLKGGIDQGIKLIDSVKLINVAVSLGECESLIEHPASMTHSTYTESERLASGIEDGLIRLSVGIEDAGDLIADLSQALEKI